VSRTVKSTTIIALGLLLFALSLSAHAQQATKISRVGFLSPIPASTISGRMEAFRQGLRELGYIEGKNLIIEWQSAEGHFDRLPELTGELIRHKVDVIVSAGPAATRALKDATALIPIVIANEADPVGTGFVASLARPGGNITGLATLAPELSGKRLELLKEIVTNLSRLAIIGTKDYASNAQSLKETEAGAETLKLKLQYLDVQKPKDIETAFRAASSGHADAVLMLLSPVLNSERPQVAALAIKHRLPVMYPAQEYVIDGGLMSYGANITDMFRRAAIYVDKILKGAKAADLPIEQPKTFELVINLKTAKQIGLAIPPNVLARADRVIK
jgi:putative tryptophan/tyrosine transport system substrate-binding protein